MKTAALVVTVLFAQAVHAQFFVSPSMGSQSGGDTVVLIATDPGIDFTRSRPTVRFGGVTAPSVTIIDAKRLRVVTPPHGEGVVDVELKVRPVRYESERKFGFVQPRDPILVPSLDAASGVPWSREVWVHNSGSEAVNLMPEVCSFIGLVSACSTRLIVPAGASVSVPPLFHGNRYFETYLYPPTEQRSSLHFSVRARVAGNSADAGTELPVAMPSDFRDGKLVLLNVPVNDRVSAVLDVYDEHRSYGGTMQVRVYDSTSGELLTTRKMERRFPTDSPARGRASFADLLSDPVVRSRENVRIEVEVPNAMLWAMLTLTDSQAQRMTVITSQ